MGSNQSNDNPPGRNRIQKTVAVLRARYSPTRDPTVHNPTSLAESCNVIPLQQPRIPYTQQISDIPDELFCLIFSWIHPRQVLGYRRVSKFLNNLLQTRSFTVLNLARHVAPRDWYDQDSYRLDELERLWFAWPEVYQEVFADYIAPLVEIQWTWEHTLTRLVAHPQIPKAMGKLINLTHLNLSHSNISGHIPGELGNLKSLQVLRLWANSISGPIPSELGSLTQLRALELGKNKLSGPIPPELGEMTNLQELQLSHNELSGPIPASLGNLKGLIRLEVQSNKLSGEIPPELGSLRCLTHLCLEKNQLSGTIPSELGNLVSLWSMNLKSNQLTGKV
ncbi:hypothetical protein HDU81_005396 [Chytriomyces hyalinus]|nr:hypothetical protein HDU81_005396 [Chytriomyces hyalinus]